MEHILDWRFAEWLQEIEKLEMGFRGTQRCSGVLTRDSSSLFLFWKARDKKKKWSAGRLVDLHTEVFIPSGLDAFIEVKDRIEGQSSTLVVSGKEDRYGCQKNLCTIGCFAPSQCVLTTLSKE